MEKYRSSADPSTGIHPFLPQTYAPTTLGRLLAPFLFLLRLPLFVLSLSAYAIISSLLPLLYFPIVVQAITRLVDKLILPVLAFSLGLLTLPIPTVERPRVRNAESSRHPGSRELIYCNHASPLDALYLAFALSPVFTVPVNGYLVPISFYEVMFGVGCAPPRRDTPSSQPKFKKYAPIIVLAEGCTTNGKGVLAFLPLGKIDTTRDSIYAMGISYSPDAREAFTVGSRMRHFVDLMCSTGCHISARLTAVSKESNIQATVATMAGVPPLRISRSSGVKFSEHWSQTTSTNK